MLPVTGSIRTVYCYKDITSLTQKKPIHGSMSVCTRHRVCEMVLVPAAAIAAESSPEVHPELCGWRCHEDGGRVSACLYECSCCISSYYSHVNTPLYTHDQNTHFISLSTNHKFSPALQIEEVHVLKGSAKKKKIDIA